MFGHLFHQVQQTIRWLQKLSNKSLNRLIARIGISIPPGEAN
ncbi:hypothetical protein SAMN02745724_04204, partial [Pseudoalteromonas denitrificans DSM 6059]